MAGTLIGAYVSSSRGGSRDAILVKYVQAGDSFPTARSDGSALHLGDWVKPKGTLPFTIGTVTFTDLRDSATWTGVEWLLNANPFQKTNETPVANRAAESVSGTANYQSNINIENKAKFDTKIDKIDTAVSIEHAVVKKSDGTYGLMQVNINANAGLAIVRRDLDKQINVPLVPAGDDDAVSKQYADTKVEHVSSLPTATVAMIGKAPVQYFGADDETVTPKLYHGYYYEVVSDGAGGAKWENINVSKGVMPYLNGVLLDGDKNTEDVRIAFKGTRAQWNALSADERKCRFAVITDEDAVPQLHIALIMNTTTGKLKARLLDVTDTTVVAESGEVEVKDINALHGGSFITTIPSGETGAGKHGIKFTKADGSVMYMVLEDSEDKLITALDTAVLKNKTISADDNTISNLETDNFKGGVVSTEIAPAASSSDTKLPTEKAVRTELDKKQDTVLAGDNITIGTDGKTISSDQIDDTLSTSTTKTWSIDAIKEGIRVMAATYRGTFATKAALTAYSGTKEKNDRAVVTTDETQGDKTTMYIFDGTSWVYEYVISDKPLEFDDSTVHINDSGKVAVKDKGITPAKFADQDTTKTEFALQVKPDGTVDFDRIRQYRTVSTFASETGNDRTLYYLASPCIIGTKSYSIGLYVWSSSTSFKQVADLGGGGGTSPILVGVVSPGGFLPTVRPDGTALVIGDFVKPYSGATFPFTVSGITFTGPNDTAVYMTAGNWLVNATVFQKTSETPVNDKTTESIDGSSSTAVYQAGINTENAAAINAAAKTVTFEKTADGKIHLNVKDRKDNDIAEVNIEKVVFEDDEQTLKNKTIEAGDNKIDPIIDVSSLPASDAKKALYRRTSDNTLWYSRDGGSTWVEVGKSIQFSIMPAASEDYTGMIIQYIGATSVDYTSGHFYVCVEQAGAYSWLSQPVQNDYVDNATIGFNSGGEKYVKDGGITLAKLATRTSEDKGKVYSIDADGKTVLSEIRNYKSVTTFTGETGDTKTLYYLSEDYTEGSVTYRKGLYIYSGTGFIPAVSADGIYLPLTGGTMTGLITFADGQTFKPEAIIDVDALPTSDINEKAIYRIQDTTAYTVKLYVRSGSRWFTVLNSANSYLERSGGTMLGAIDMSFKKITSLATPTDNADAVNKSYVDDKFVSYLPLAGGTMTGSIAVKSGDKSIVGTDNASYVRISGGKSENEGASLILRGKNNTSGRGNFKLFANNGSISVELVGETDGTLRWNGKDILREDTADERYLKLAGGTMTGSIIHPDNGGIPFVKGLRNTDNNCIACGGTAYDDGASIWLAGKGHNGGTFGIDAYDGTNRCSLIGDANGNLFWRGVNLLNGISASIGWGTSCTINAPFNIIGHNGFVIDVDGIFPIICWSAAPSITGTKFTISSYAYGTPSSITITCTTGDNQFSVVLF